MAELDASIPCSVPAHLVPHPRSVSHASCQQVTPHSGAILTQLLPGQTKAPSEVFLQLQKVSAAPEGAG